jgi:hypothetical protein
LDCGPIWRAHIFGARMFIFTRHRPMTNAFLNTNFKLNRSMCSGASEAYIHPSIHPLIHTFIHTNSIPKTTSVYSGEFWTWNPIKIAAIRLFTITYFLIYTTHCVKIQSEDESEPN